MWCIDTINKLHTLLAIDSVVENNLVPCFVGRGSLAENGLAEGLLTQASNMSMPKGDREERVENRDSLHGD